MVPHPGGLGTDSHLWFGWFQSLLGATLNVMQSFLPLMVGGPGTRVLAIGMVCVAALNRLLLFFMQQEAPEITGNLGSKLFGWFQYLQAAGGVVLLAVQQFLPSVQAALDPSTYLVLMVTTGIVNVVLTHVANRPPPI